jgi:predicted ester cyclase
MCKAKSLNYDHVYLFLSIRRIVVNTKEIAEAYLDAFNSGDLDALADLLADDFQFSGPVPEPMDQDQFLGLMELMWNAFPDIRFNARIVDVNRNVLHFTAQLVGTHTGDLDLSSMGMGVIPPTGRSFSMARENGETVFENGYVVSHHVNPTEGAGLMAILQQLGIRVPHR